MCKQTAPAIWTGQREMVPAQAYLTLEDYDKVKPAAVHLPGNSIRSSLKSSGIDSVRILGSSLKQRSLEALWH